METAGNLVYEDSLDALNDERLYHQSTSLMSASSQANKMSFVNLEEEDIAPETEGNNNLIYENSLDLPDIELYQRSGSMVSVEPKDTPQGDANLSFPSIDIENTSDIIN